MQNEREADFIPPADMIFTKPTMPVSSKAKTHFVCQQCGAQSPKWLGRCMSCDAWSSLVEEPLVRAVSNPTAPAAASMLIALEDAREPARLSTGIDELDRVLGGGLVPGGVVLVGGEPGVGKSTLLLQALAPLTERALYASAEESAAQVAARAQRLGMSRALRIACTGSLGEIEALILAHKPEVVVVDSLQTVSSDELESAPGSVSQVREVAHRLAALAKQQQVAIFLVGQITKDGALAGPKVVEHLVDVVLYFDSDPGEQLRLLRAHKNRYGAATEVGIFEMTESGLQTVVNPSERFLSERSVNAPGSVVTAQLEGTRPLLVEVQALCVPSPFGLPRRTALGVDTNRVAMLLAVLERHAATTVAGCDVFASAVGGLRLFDPASDVAVALAVASSFRQRAVGREVVAFGEVGLTGEVRKVGRAKERVDEARRLGFKRIVLPAGNANRIEDRGDLVFVKSLAHALEVIA